MLDDLGVDQNTEEDVMEILTLPKISANVLKKVIDWCQHKPKKDSILAKRNSIQEETGPKRIIPNCWLTGWESKFISSINAIDGSGKSILFDITIAANYLDIQSLTDLTTMEIARILKGETPQEIRDIFNIENDLVLKHDSEYEGSRMSFLNQRRNKTVSKTDTKR